MKRLLVIAAVFLFLGMSINSYYKMEYGSGVWSYYFGGPQTLTEEESQWLRDKKMLIYGADYNSPPLRYVNAQTEQYEGMVIEYMQALSLELGVPIECRPMPWSEALQKLSNKETDLCDMYPSEGRAKQFSFTDAVYYQRGAILTLRGKGVASKRDLEGKVIGANKGDYVVEYLKQNYKSVEAIQTKDLQESIKLLEAGKVQAVLGDESVMNDFLMQMAGKERYVILDSYLYEREAVLGVPKGEEKLVGILNKGIAALNKRGTMEKIHQKWFGVTPLITKDRQNERDAFFTRYLMLAIAFGAGLLYLWNVELKREVQKRTLELSLSRNELETTFNGLTQVLLVMDETCTLLEANKPFYEQQGLTNEDVKGMACAGKLVPCLEGGCAACIVPKTFELGKSLTWEVNQNGRIYELSTYPLEGLHGLQKRLLVMIEDVTTLKIASQNMLQSSKMAAVGQLAAGVAHEIRNPLGIIRNNAYLMKRRSKEEETLETVHEIESSVERVNKIIDNLLNFSRLTSDHAMELNLNQFVVDILTLNDQAFKNRKIEWRVYSDQSIEAMVMEESLKHILMNLASNAIDAMPEGGQFEVHIEKVLSQIILKIKDTGSGMKPEVIEHIFNPFYTTKDPGSGTGLGLYIVYNEVAKMGGTILVESAVGAGSTFIIEFPIGGARDGE